MGGIVQDRAEELILSSPTACRVSRLSPVTQREFFFFNLFVEPAGTPCLDVTSPTHREQCTGHYASVKVAEQSVANVG